MTPLRRLRLVAGALAYDWPDFERRLRGFGAGAGQPEPWLGIHNRADHLTSDSRGFRCEWRFGHDLHIANVLPSMSKRLMRVALERWPIVMTDVPRYQGA